MASSKKTYSALKADCKALALHVKASRIKDASPSEDTGEHVRASRIKMPEDTAEQLSETCWDESLQEAFIRRWGNSAGLTILERLDGLEKEVAAQNQRLVELEDATEQLKLASAAYFNIRSRFFSIFKRDILGNATPGDQQIIQSCDIAAHNGDALVDAVMFQNAIRSDHSTFRALYGIDYNRVLQYSRLIYSPLLQSFAECELTL